MERSEGRSDSLADAPASLPLRARRLDPRGIPDRRQQEAIDYLREENRVLREMLGGRRLRFTDTQRKRLAIRGKALGRAILKGITTLIQPDTILDWHRRLVAKKWTFPMQGSRRDLEP